MIGHAGTAEAPKLRRGLLVPPMDHVVKLENIDVAVVESGEAAADAFEQPAQVRLVVGGDQLPRRSARGLLIAGVGGGRSLRTGRPAGNRPHGNYARFQSDPFVMGRQIELTGQ
jgi:hypothetical protein